MTPTLTYLANRIFRLDDGKPSKEFGSGTPDDPHTAPLRLLNQLDRVDKHRELLVAVVAIVGASWGSNLDEPAPTYQVSPPPIESGFPAVRWAFPQPRTRFDPDIELQVRFVAVPELDPMVGIFEVGGLLEVIAWQVEWVVFHKLERWLND